MQGPKSGPASAAVRRGARARKVSQRIGIVSAAEQQQAVTARLEALENDTAAPDAAAETDDEFVMPVDSDGEADIQFGPSSGKRKKARASGGKRKTRGQLAERRSGRSFATLLLKANLDDLPPEIPSYITAAAGPPRTSAPRKFCSVCGNTASYKCVRCAGRFCTRKCYGIHNETRCLKFMA